MHAIILAAGLGARLGPITATRPKCLVELDKGASLLDLQLDGLQQTGAIDNAFVVTGHLAPLVAASLRKRRRGPHTEIVFNPFYSDCGALVSLWLAMQRRPHEFVVLNGDTAFSPSCLAAAVEQPRGAAVHIIVSRREGRDTDAMGVASNHGLLVDIGKNLDAVLATNQSAGLVHFDPSATETAASAIEDMISHRHERQSYWHALLLRLVQTGLPIKLLERPSRDWVEIDDMADLERARKRVREWRKHGHTECQSARQQISPAGKS